MNTENQCAVTHDTYLCTLYIMPTHQAILASYVAESASHTLASSTISGVKWKAVIFHPEGMQDSGPSKHGRLPALNLIREPDEDNPRVTIMILCNSSFIS